MRRDGEGWEGLTGMVCHLDGNDVLQLQHHLGTSTLKHSKNIFLIVPTAEAQDQSFLLQLEKKALDRQERLGETDTIRTKLPAGTGSDGKGWEGMRRDG